MDDGQKTVRGGSFCAPLGATAVSSANTPMICSTTDAAPRARWRRSGPTPARARTPRARATRNSGGGRAAPAGQSLADATSIASITPVQLPSVAAAADPVLAAAIDAGDIGQVAIYCDRRCGTEFRADFTGATTEIRYAAARKVLAGRGWAIGAEDICPTCRRVHDPADDLDARIRAAYADLADGRPGARVDLAALRAKLGDVDRAELDKALEGMLDSDDVSLEPEPFGARVGPDEKDAAVHIGGEDRHKISIRPADGRTPAPTTPEAAPAEDLDTRYARIIAGEPIRDALDSGRAPTAPGTPSGPVTGARSTTPREENQWGGAGGGRKVHFHDDGPLGSAIKSMGADADMDVDGLPLADVIGIAATDVVMGRDTAQGCIDRMRTLHDRLPEGSTAKRQLGYAIEDMDAPMTAAPELPDGTPEPIRQLAAVLHSVPACRRKPDREIEPLVEIARNVSSGKTGGSRLANEVEQLANRVHESRGEEGKMQIDRAVVAAARALDIDRRIAVAERVSAGESYTDAEREAYLKRLPALRQERASIVIG